MWPGFSDLARTGVLAPEESQTWAGGGGVPGADMGQGTQIRELKTVVTNKGTRSSAFQLGKQLLFPDTLFQDPKGKVRGFVESLGRGFTSEGEEACVSNTILLLREWERITV